MEEEFNADDNLIYKPPPLHKVWLDEPGRRQGKEDLLRQHCRNEDLMHIQHRDLREKVGDTPTPPVVDDPVPGCGAILDNDSDASSVCSQNSEPEGEYVDDYDDDNSFLHIPNPRPALNIKNEGAGPNIVPEGDDSVQAPEGVPLPPAPNIR